MAADAAQLGDPRTLGLLFHACCDEARDLSYLEALRRTLTLARLNLRGSKQVADELRQAIMSEVLRQAFYLHGLGRRQYQRSKGVGD